MEYPEFVENKTFSSLDKSKSELEQLVGMSENLKKIHLLTSKSYDSFEDLIAHYLKAGIDIFQMETGIVSHIINDKDYIVKDVISPLDIFGPGDVFELDGTYCREVHKTEKVIGFPQVGLIDEMKGHPVYQNLKLEAYISAPIFVRDTLYGTLNFTSRNPRRYGFSEHEHDLIALMANSIGNFILLQEKENSLLKLNDRLKTFVGYVAHDLRNPLGVVSNLAQIAVSIEQSEEEKLNLFNRIHTNADRCLEMVNTILDLAALGTGKITINPQSFLFKQSLNHAVENYTSLAKERNISIKVDIPEELKVVGDEPRLLQMFNNLLGNAIKYSVSGKHVDIIYLGEEDDRVSIAISNSYNNENLEKESLNNDLYKSIGFGLDIAREILNLHGSNLEITQDDGLFSVKINLPVSKD